MILWRRRRFIERSLTTCLIMGTVAFGATAIDQARAASGNCSPDTSPNPAKITAGKTTSFHVYYYCFDNENFTFLPDAITIEIPSLPAGVEFSPKTTNADTASSNGTTITITTKGSTKPGVINLQVGGKGKTCASYSANGAYCPEQFTIVPPLPVNFRQVSDAVLPHGVLQFTYEWDSTSGDVKDLTDCKVGENVTYPGGSPFIWPKPPYDASWINPTIIMDAATKGTDPDTHSPPKFSKPPYAATGPITASQDYLYDCPSTGKVNFPGWTGIAITRTVADTTGRGCWVYTITKSGLTSSETLPGVAATACGPASVAESPGSKYIGNEIGMSVSPPTVSVGLNEPIFVDLTVSNRTAQTVGIDLGRNDKSNLELTISDPTGAVVTETLSPGGFGGSGEISLPPQGTFAEKVLLNEWYPFPLTGAYSIKMTLLDGDGTASAASPSTEFSVQVGPRNPSKLALLARELADKAITGATIAEKMEAAITLSYIVDPVAVDSLVRVLQQGSMVAHYAVDGLGRIGNPEAIEALTAARDYLDDEVRTSVRYTLQVLQGNAPKGSGPID
jgi:PBS lyase HEAT-like repeat